MTIKEIARCRSRAERVGMCIEWLRAREGNITIVTLDGCVSLWINGRYEDAGPRLDALLLDACRRVEKESK